MVKDQLLTRLLVSIQQTLCSENGCYENSLYFLQEKLRLAMNNPDLKLQKCVGRWREVRSQTIWNKPLKNHILGEKFWLRQNLVLRLVDNKKAAIELLKNYEIASIESKSVKIMFGEELVCFKFS